jgi:hypothetical protein
MVRTTVAVFLLCALMPACRTASPPPLSGGSAWSSVAMTVDDPVAAPVADEGWTFSATPYLWAADLDGNTTVGPLKVDFDIPFSETLDNLDSAGLVLLEARNGAWTWLLDNTYLSLSADGTGPGLLGIPVDVGARLWLAQLDLLHDVNEDGSVQAGLGVRRTELSTAVQLGATPAVRSEKHVVDTVAVARGLWELDDDWGMVLYGDAGGGDSKFTWQALASVRYAYDGWDFSLGYRVIDYEIDSGSTDTDVTMKGPIIGARLRF